MDKNDNSKYNETNGTGVLSAIVFIVVATVIMVVAAHFIN